MKQIKTIYSLLIFVVLITHVQSQTNNTSKYNQFIIVSNSLSTTIEFNGVKADLNNISKKNLDSVIGRIGSAKNKQYTSSKKVDGKTIYFKKEQTEVQYSYPFLNSISSVQSFDTLDIFFLRMRKFNDSIYSLSVNGLLFSPEVSLNTIQSDSNYVKYISKYFGEADWNNPSVTLVFDTLLLQVRVDDKSKKIDHLMFYLKED